MTTLSPTFSLPSPQKGSVLVVALILLLVLTLLGLGSMRQSAMQEKMVRNSRDRQLAMMAAEAALLAGERHVSSSHPTFTDQCNNGFCTQGCPSKPRWSDVSLDVWNQAGRHQTDSIDLRGTVSRPKYIIEDLCEYATKSWLDANPGASDLPQRAYRITALGSGGTTEAQVMLQSIYVVTRVVDPTCTPCNPATLAANTPLPGLPLYYLAAR
ncbi:MAG: pilus assembly protein [Magnetococcales bacterium]|nr:pilus assembly protein [Magnetococcales bacterium]